MAGIAETHQNDARLGSVLVLTEGAHFKGRSTHYSSLRCLLRSAVQVPYYLIDVGAPFSAAFNLINGWHWAAYLVGTCLHPLQHSLCQAPLE